MQQERGDTVAQFYMLKCNFYDVIEKKKKTEAGSRFIEKQMNGRGGGA